MGDLELMEFGSLLPKDDRLRALKAQWEAERAAKEKGLTAEQIALSRLQEQIDLYNETDGDLKYVDCPKCKNKGDIAYIKDGAEFYRPCECMAERRSRNLMAVSGLNGVLDEYTFDKYKVATKWQESLKTGCQDYVANSKGEWLVISGQSGCGKTHLCTAVMGEYLKQGFYSLYISFAEKITELKQLQFRDEGKFQELLRTYQQCDLLYIDDLFYTQPSEADINLTFQILDYRIKANKKTIISTERSFADLIEIRESAFGRIHQACGKYKFGIGKDSKKNYRMR